MPTRLASTMRWIFFIWFILISLLIFIPSVDLWLHSREMEARHYSREIETRQSLGLESPPIEASLKGLGVEEIQARAKWLEAYVKYLTEVAKLDAERSDSRIEAYRLVVKDTLAALVGSFVTVLLGYAFARTSGQVASRMLQPAAARSGEPPPIEPL